MTQVRIEQIMGGGLQEQFVKAFERVIDNLADPNTSFKESRKITIELKFNQNEARDDVSCAVSVKEKLAAQAPMQTAFVIGKDLKTGEMYAEEYGRHSPLKGQMTIEQANVDPDTRENVTGSVVDFRIAASR